MLALRKKKILRHLVLFSILAVALSTFVLFSATEQSTFVID
jgi:hypothetical protein